MSSAGSGFRLFGIIELPVENASGRRTKPNAGFAHQVSSSAKRLRWTMSSVFQSSSNPDDIKDLDFFPFPTLGTQYDDEAALDAPIDTWQMAAKSPYLTAEMDQGKAYLEFWSKGATQGIFFQHQPGTIPTGKDADTSTYSDLQKKAVEVVGKAKKITQFLDRDTRSDFAGPQGMQGFLQKWLANPSQDMTAYQKSIQDFWDQLPPLT